MYSDLEISYERESRTVSFELSVITDIALNMGVTRSRDMAPDS